MAQTLTDNVTLFKIVRACKLTTAMGVLTLHVGVTSKIYGRTKINTYVAFTNMLPARDTIQGRPDGIWYASLGMSEGTNMYSKSTWHNDNA